MGLPDRDFYLVDNERNRAIQAAYKSYLAFLLGKAGYPDPVATAERSTRSSTRSPRSSGHAPRCVTTT